MTPAAQRNALGISAHSSDGLILIEIAGPPAVALTPAELRRFHVWLERAYRDAIRDRDCLHPRAAARERRAA